MDKLLDKHSFTFNEHDNGGEQLILYSRFYNGDSGVYLNQTLTLNSYGNSVALNLYGALLTPELLRQLADQLEECEENAKNQSEDSDTE